MPETGVDTGKLTSGLLCAAQVTVFSESKQIQSVEHDTANLLFFCAFVDLDKMNDKLGRSLRVFCCLQLPMHDFLANSYSWQFVL